MYTLTGTLVAAYDGLGPVLQGQDFTPITSKIMDKLHIPTDFRSLVLGVFVAATGELFVYMRKISPTPISDSDATKPL